MDSMVSFLKGREKKSCVLLRGVTIGKLFNVLASMSYSVKWVGFSDLYKMPSTLKNILILTCQLWNYLGVEMGCLFRDR